MAAVRPIPAAVIKSTAPVLKEHGVTITTLFYNNMLKAHPELNNIFNKTSQDTGDQPRALASAVFAYASYVDDLGKLSPTVERIAHKHVSLTVEPDHYPIVGKHLLAAVATVLGDAMTPEIGDAWTAAYAALADVFINREKVLYAGFENWQGWRKFKIQKKVPESSEITSFYLVPEDGQPLPLFKPGQYVSLHLFVPELDSMQPRQYSLSESPRSDYYRISVKKDSGKQTGLPGLISNMLHEEYDEGDVIELTHPTGDFFVDTEAAATTAPVILISAGVGATPMMSILDSTLEAKSTRPVSWVHGTHSTEVQAFGEQIHSTCEKNPSVTSTIFKTSVRETDISGVDFNFTGRVDLAKMDRKTGLYLDDQTAEYYICGPEEFMKNVREWLHKAGVNDSRIHMEIFGTGGDY
ncbi:globin-like protein [Pseudomassariella vexata]|uniref:nitric oxide dioxygenase n=1 Tax=Pseudomassariella vexata TaxID=1141098 RepID=A0A1Y2DGW8_9PEZI|nr:globin-like protein [Pseudomassariella vexata]ORY58487.1 globin-like protein [Pseudomassariella vexata]